MFSITNKSKFIKHILHFLESKKSHKFEVTVTGMVVKVLISPNKLCDISIMIKKGSHYAMNA